MAYNVTSHFRSITKSITISIPIAGWSLFGQERLNSQKDQFKSPALGKIISTSNACDQHQSVLTRFRSYWFSKVNAASFNPTSYPHLRLSSKWDTNWDRREPRTSPSSTKKQPESSGIRKGKTPVKRKVIPTASRHILLIRHGQYNDKGRNDMEHYLTTIGREQADITGARLATLDLPYTSLTSSTMTRALETAAIINVHLPELSHMKDSVLREGLPVIPSPDAIGEWNAKRLFSDGARLESAFRKYFHRADVAQQDDSFEIIVCHANVIRYFICRSMQFPPEGWMRLSLTNCSLTLITIEPNGHVLMEMMGDHGHMPSRDYITFS